jgi:hypothetical protein
LSKAQKNLEQGDAPILVVDDSRPDIQVGVVVVYKDQDQYNKHLANPTDAKRGRDYLWKINFFDVAAKDVFEWLRINHTKYLKYETTLLFHQAQES